MNSSNTLTISVLFTIMMRAVISVFFITTLMVMCSLHYPLEDSSILDENRYNHSISVVTNDVGEAGNYTLVYQLDIPDIANHNNEAVA